MKFIAAVLSICLIGLYLYCCYSPKQLASSADNIPEFFDLPSNCVKGMTVFDELHSQGKTTFSFGLNHYWLKFRDNRDAIEAIKDAGGTLNDSFWSITKQRGDYIGTFSVSLKDNTGHLRYAEIEE